MHPFDMRLICQIFSVISELKFTAATSYNLLHPAIPPSTVLTLYPKEDRALAAIYYLWPWAQNVIISLFFGICFKDSTEASVSTGITTESG